MKTVEEIKEFYFSNLKETLDRLEAQRKKVKSRVILAFLAFTSLYGGLAYNFIDEILSNEDGLQFVIFGYIGIGGLIYKFLLKDYTNSFKNKIIDPLIRSIDDTFIYVEDTHVSSDFFNRADLFRKPDRLTGNDYVKGFVNGVSLEFSDLHAEKKSTSSKGKTRWRTIFQGLFIIAKFNKRFHGKTVVLPDTAQSIFGSMIGNWFQSKNAARDELVKMDNLEFEKEFVVYSSDQIEARYILTPTMMEKLLEFKKKSRYPIYISFVNESIHMAVYNDKDHFEPTIFSSLLDYEVAAEYINNLHLAVGIVDDLNLNEKLWSKRS